MIDLKKSFIAEYILILLASYDYRQWENLKPFYILHPRLISLPINLT